MISHQLNGDLEEALETYDGLMSCLKTDGATEPEKSQTLMHIGFRDGVISPRGESTRLKGAFSEVAFL